MKEIVKHEGKEYQIGKVYEFSDNGEFWVASKLTSIDSSRYPFNFDGGNCHSKLCCEMVEKQKVKSNERFY